MPKDEYNELLQNIKLIKYGQLKMIFREGDFADNFYVILSGSVFVLAPMTKKFSAL
jgi:CRP-like cAMP-binding protein